MVVSSSPKNICDRILFFVTEFPKGGEPAVGTMFALVSALFGRFCRLSFTSSISTKAEDALLGKRPNKLKAAAVAGGGAGVRSTCQVRLNLSVLEMLGSCTSSCAHLAWPSTAPRATPLASAPATLCCVQASRVPKVPAGVCTSFHHNAMCGAFTWKAYAGGLNAAVGHGYEDPAGHTIG